MSIRTDSLELTPGLDPANCSRDAMGALNVNLRSKSSAAWLKAKLRTFMLRKNACYFQSDVNEQETAFESLTLLLSVAAEKFVKCCLELKMFHSSKAKFKTNGCRVSIDQKICQIIVAEVYNQFEFLSLKAKPSLLSHETDRNRFVAVSLQIFLQKFSKKKSYFGEICKILSKTSQNVISKDPD